MNLSDAKTRAWLLDYYRPLVGMTLVGVLAGTVPALVVVDEAGQEFELSCMCDEEGNHPGFLFFASDDPAEQEIEIEDLRISDVLLGHGEYDDEWTYWPTLVLERPGKPSLRIEVSQDPEGNGAGHLHGVPAATERVVAVEDGPRLRDSDLAQR